MNENAILTGMSDATESGDMDLLTFYASKTTNKDLLGDALCRAAVNGQIKMIQKLLELGADINHLSGERASRTPLHFASFNVRPRTVLYLLRNGASKTSMDFANRTPEDRAQSLYEGHKNNEFSVLKEPLELILTYLRTEPINSLPELTDFSPEPFPGLNNESNNNESNNNNENNDNSNISNSDNNINLAEVVKKGVNTADPMVYIVARTPLGDSYVSSIELSPKNEYVPMRHSQADMREVFSKAKGNRFCEGLNKYYVRSSFEKCDFFVYVLSNEFSQDLMGFVTVKIKSPTNFYIDVICSNVEYAGVGKRLLDYVKRLAKIKNVSEVSLNSVYGAEGFYRKQDFAKTGQFKNGLITMKHKVVGGYHKGRITRCRKATRNTTRKARK